MAECKYCGRTGIFLAVTKNGLCGNCDPIVAMDVLQRGRIINDSMKLVKSSKKLDIKLSRSDLLIQHASALLKYEERGIPTLKPLPSVLAKEYQAQRDPMIFNFLTSEFESLKANLNVTASVKSKVNSLSKLLLKIREYKALVSKANILDALEGEVTDLVHKTQLSGYLDEAKKAEFKGQKKKALDQYYEALYFLRNDQINDTLQKENISFIESKITELGGMVT